MLMNVTLTTMYATPMPIASIHLDHIIVVVRLDMAVMVPHVI